MTLESGLKRNVWCSQKKQEALESIKHPKEREEIKENSSEQTNKEKEEDNEVVVGNVAATSQ